MDIFIREYDEVRGTMSYGERKDYDDCILYRFDHMDDLDLINEDGSISRKLMLYIGREDIKGNKVYNLDYVKDIDGGNVYLVKYDKGSCSYRLYLIEDVSLNSYRYIKEGLKLEVVGNYYETKRGLLV